MVGVGSVVQSKGVVCIGGVMQCRKVEGVGGGRCRQSGAKFEVVCVGSVRSIVDSR